MIGKSIMHNEDKGVSVQGLENKGAKNERGSEGNHNGQKKSKITKARQPKTWEEEIARIGGSGDVRVSARGKEWGGGQISAGTRAAAEDLSVSWPPSATPRRSSTSPAQMPPCQASPASRDRILPR